MTPASHAEVDDDDGKTWSTIGFRLSGDFVKTKQKTLSQNLSRGHRFFAQKFVVRDRSDVYDVFRAGIVFYVLCI